ncbi:MAG: proline dehydrogenase family protein [Gammaproteobacteria bacterium]|nr:proline dehydrogenase family protein [Gammaproteobacteria bacterium]
MQRDAQGLETLVQAHGRRLLARTQAVAARESPADRWIRELLLRLNRDQRFRIQALRFIDVLPTLDDDATLAALFHEYFADQDFPLPPMGGLALKAGRVLGDRVVSAAVRAAAAQISRRFMAGADLAAVLALHGRLEARGFRVSLDRVGEVTLSTAEAERYLHGYLELVDRAEQAGTRSLQLSVKLSSLAPRIAPHSLDRSADVVMERLRLLVRALRAAGAGMTLDMEDYDKRPLVLAVFARLIGDPEFADWDGVGIALQAYLRDAAADVAHLVELARRRDVPFHVRLVRGAYWDQETVLATQHGWPVPVWSSKAQTDACFEDCAARLLDAYPRLHTAIATHNPRSVAVAMACAERRAMPQNAVEFQMLYGMADALQAALLDLDYPLRVYVPFGEPIPGMAYLVRRLLENASSQSLERWFDAESGGDADLLAAPVATGDGHAAPVAAGFGNTPPRRFVDAAERDAYATALRRVRAELGADVAPLIDGREAASDDVRRSTSPADPDLLIGSVGQAGVAEADLAIDVAQRAFPAWASRPARERADLMRSVAERLRADRDRFAAYQVFEAGKNWTEADADVCEAIDFLMFYADEAERLALPGGISVAGEANRYGYQPRGVAVVIPPWNFPLAILTGMLSAALVSGNCALLKPSSDTPVIAARLVELMLEAGVPPGVVAYLPGPGAAVGEYLVDHPATHVVAFTGSRDVGCRLLQRAAVVQAGQRHVKRVIAEMGGKNAIIVDASADPDEAIAGILRSAFGFQGQKCSACSRVIVVGGLHDALLERLCDAVSGLIMDLPWEPHCDLGPVINDAAAQRIEAVIADAETQATLRYRAEVPAHLHGSFVAPAIFAGVDPSSPLAQHEIFGPVVAVMQAADFDDALRVANDTDYALTGGVYSRSPANLRRAAEQFRVGNLYLNRGITGALVARQPFGGFRLSGIGSKAGGPDYLLQFMEPRCVTENTMRRGVAPTGDDLSGDLY